MCNPGMSSYRIRLESTITKQRMPHNFVKTWYPVKSAHKNIFISTHFIHCTQSYTNNHSVLCKAFSV